MPRFLAARAPLSRAVTLAVALAAPLAVLALESCGSTASSRATEEPVRTRALRVRFVDWRSGQNLVLVDESHTEPVALYSEKRSLEDAVTKVTTDEVLEETLAYFQKQGFFDRARNGPAVAGSAQSLEVETPDSTVHMDLGAGTSAEDGKVFRACRDAFAELYNSVFQLQSVDPKRKGASTSSGKQAP